MEEQAKRPNQIDIDVGRRIRLQRNVMGMSQTTLADALGITFQQVQKYEKGTNRVGASRLSNIARILNVPVSYFFGDQSPVSAGLAPLDELAQFLSTAEGQDLNTAFARVKSATMRKKIVDLVKALAESRNDGVSLH